MEQTQLLERIKKNHGSVEKFAQKHDVKNRQTMYNYIKYYNQGELTKIPKEVCKDFNQLMKTDNAKSVDEIGFMETLKKRGDVFEESRAINYAITLAKEEKKELEEELNSVHQSSKIILGDGLEISGDEYREHLTEEIRKIDEYIGMLSEESEQISKELMKSIYDNYTKEEEPIDSKLKRMVNSGMYGGPSWKGSGDICTLCLSDSGHYMVITDFFERGFGRVELRLYALISGRRVHIATYPFKDGESFVSFDLIPKIPYFYEVIDRSDRKYTSGIQELIDNS